MANLSNQVKFLDNGLLSMETTPHHLLAIVQRNALESPLLQLPSEIRNRIFTLAMGGSYIVLRCLVSEDSWHKSSQCVYRGKQISPDPSYHSSGTAFHLPEVCRQIYSESATIGYATNLFVFHRLFLHNPDGRARDGDGIGDWTRTLKKAQLHAIKNIAISLCHISLYCHDDDRIATLKSSVPSLRTLVVRDRIDANLLGSMGYREELLRKQVKANIGSDVIVEFDMQPLEKGRWF